MKISPTSLDRISILGLILLYPGFFFYHSAIALLGMPAFLGGYYGVVSATLLPVLLIARFLDLKFGRIRIVGFDVALAVTMVFMLTWTWIYSHMGYAYQRDTAVSAQSYSIVVLWLTNYLIFRRMNVASSRLALILTISLFGMAAISFFNQTSGFFYARQFADGANDELVATYQGFARSAFVTSMILLCTLKVRWLPALYAGALVLLFVLGARSEFAIFLVVGLGGLLLRMGRLKFSMLLLPFTVMVIFVIGDILSSDVGDSRIVRLLDLNSDNSYQMREYFSEAAMQTIVESPLFGDYGSHTLQGGTGTYAHNLLSSWVSFGVIGFLLVTYLIFSPVFKIGMQFRTSIMRIQVVQLALLFGIASILMAVFAKSIYYPVYAIGWGLYAFSFDRSIYGQTDAINKLN